MNILWTLIRIHTDRSWGLRSRKILCLFWYAKSLVILIILMLFALLRYYRYFPSSVFAWSHSLSVYANLSWSYLDTIYMCACVCVYIYIFPKIIWEHNVRTQTTVRANMIKTWCFNLMFYLLTCTVTCLGLTLLLCQCILYSIFLHCKISPMGVSQKDTSSYMIYTHVGYSWLRQLLIQ